MKLNKKGYTLIELLAVILIIGLILVFSTYGIIKAIKSSKGKAATLSEKSIKEAAETYATEKNDDSNYWLDITDKENKYFCTTIEELMNKGLLDKKAESTKFKKSDFVLVKKNKVTNVNSKAEILTNDNNNDDYKVCSGNIVNEEVIEYPKLDNGTSYTDEIHVGFTDANTNPSSTMTDKVCMYGDSTANIKETGVIEDNTCKLQGLKQNEKYYFKSTIKGTSNINVKRCTLSNNIFTCDGNTTTIEKNTWYQSSSDQISVSYTTTGKASVTARTVDKSNNYSESTKDFTINKYTITFNKGSADKIGGEVSNISKSCYAISGQSCSITSPDIEKKGYTIIGWNTNKNATTSIWNINTSKSISSSATYYPILKANIYTITLNNQGATSSGTKKVYYQYNTTKTINGTTCYYYTNSSLTTCLSGGYNINKPSKTGYSFKGYYTSTNGSGTNYVNSSGTFINNAYKTIGDKTLYANWQANTYTITYNANGGSGAPSSQSYTYDPNNDTVFYLSSTTPSRSGYTFLGWSLSSTATSASYSAGQRWGTHNANNYTLYAVWKKTVTVCGESGHVWKTRGIKIISTRFTWTCTRGENHTTAYIIYCSKCGMSALYYEDHYSGSAGATLMCPTHPYDIGSSEVDKVVDDCSLSSYSDARKVSGGSNSFASTNKRSC